MAEAMRLHAPTSDIVAHLGDGIEDIDPFRDKYTGLEYLCVSGNHEDTFSKQYHRPSPVLFYEICGIRLMLCHGHRYGVKYGCEMLAAAAMREKADIVLFGHTHQSFQQYIPRRGEAGDLRLFCPGSITKPSYGLPSYGIIEIRENGILMTNIEMTDRIKPFRQKTPDR